MSLSAFAELADHLQDALGRCQDFRRGALGRDDDGVELVRRGGEPVVAVFRRAQCRDFAPGLGDRRAHVLKLVAQDLDAVHEIVGVGLLAPQVAEVRDQHAHFLRDAGLCAPCMFTQKFPTARGAGNEFLNLLELRLRQMSGLSHPHPPAGRSRPMGSNRSVHSILPERSNQHYPWTGKRNVFSGPREDGFSARVGRVISVIPPSASLGRA